ncbi:MAG: DoxX-like family protein [Aggregatilineales bacterium]
MNQSKSGIYVEILICGNIEELWEKTQNPALHKRWDLRFTDIDYLPHLDESQPQQFLYATRIGFGLRISGAGESIGNRDDGQGNRTSALKFWSDDPKSLIRKGSGYWKYIQQAGGVRFLTWYDYDTRFGVIGRLVDKAFRPLIGWATAWSFDRLRLWIEKGIDPAWSLRSSLIHSLARISIAFIWLYQGLVPKLLFTQRDELVMMREAGIAAGSVSQAVQLFGIAEIVFGIAMLVMWRRRWLFLINVGLMVLATLAIILNSSEYVVMAFNPVTLNLAVIAFAVIGFLLGNDLPSARHCLRRAKGDTA